MKRFGSVTLILAGFIAGLVFVYSCNLGGNGNDAEAQPRSPLDIQSYYVELTSTSSIKDQDPFGNESFIITDISVNSISNFNTEIVLSEKSTREVRFRFVKSAGTTIPFTESIHFNSGIVFNPGETMRVEGFNLAPGIITSVNISGYLATN